MKLLIIVGIFIYILYLFYDNFIIINNHEKKYLSEITEIYNYNNNYTLLVQSSNNLKEPVVIRKLFINSYAVNNWNDTNYLKNIFGNYNVPIINNEDNYQDRIVDKFSNIIDSNKTYLILFPYLSRSKLNLNSNNYTTQNNFINDVKGLINNNLSYQSIINDDYLFNNSNIIHTISIGKNNNSTPKENGGIQWHTEASSNYFIQIVGKKRWYLSNNDHQFCPKFFSTVSLKATCNTKIDDLIHLNNIKYVDLYPGDMLFIPDWYWHNTIGNNNISIGVSIRKLHLLNAFNNHFLYSMISIYNILTLFIFG